MNESQFSRIEKIGQLYQKGLLTLAEFEQLKREILGTTVVPEQSADEHKASKWWQVLLMTLLAFLVAYGAYKLIKDLVVLFTS